MVMKKATARRMKRKFNKTRRMKKQTGGDPTSSNILTATPGRLIYFNGLADDPNGAMVCKLFANYYTVSELHKLEAATRTLSNLYNLHATRGILGPHGLEFKTSMTGPHHYGGFIYPTDWHTIDTASMTYRKVEPPLSVPALEELPDEYKKRFASGTYEWKSGRSLASELIDVDTGKPVTAGLTADSLFELPGMLTLPEQVMKLNIIEEPYKYDLRQYHAQVVKNEEPWCFDQELVSKFPHAQHKLRIVTYNYGDDYVPEYLNKGSGIFIERHDFIQAITPMNEKCGGFAMVGKEDKDGLELVGIKVPYGYTLLVDSGAIHGDSTMTGLYMMAMTGHHGAMATADTVFMKTADKQNVFVEPAVPLPRVPGMSGTEFLVASDEKPLAELRDEVRALEAKMKGEKPWWSRIVFNPRMFASTWGPKTKGVPL